MWLFLCALLSALLLLEPTAANRANSCAERFYFPLQDRSLLAHRASGGSSLHAVGVTDSTFYYTTNGNGAFKARRLAAELHSLSSCSYSPAHASLVRRALLCVLNDVISHTLFPPGPPTGSWAQNNVRTYYEKSKCYTASAPVSITTASGLGYLHPSYKDGSGITAVHFPSRLVGVAVGLGCSNVAFTTFDGVDVAAPATSTPSYIPTILTTFDQGTSWLVRMPLRSTGTP